MSSLHRSGVQLHRLRQFNESFRQKRTRLGQSFREQRKVLQNRVIENRMRLHRLQQMPRWLKFMKKIYHQYGLKHLLLFLVLIVYQFLGAGLFCLLEANAEQNRDRDWSNYLMFLSADQTDQIYRMLESNLIEYEFQLGIKFSDQKIHWDFWNAMLFAGTICTTIGYGHLYPSTPEGRFFTMVYAIFGIPLVLSILDDLGKLLTKIMKYPWFVTKMGSRRLFQYCTKQSMEEIHRLDREDREGLETFDLPVPVAIFIVVTWIFVCSATFCVWEDWDYFVAFYFFFISLSTVGLGDIVPQKPKYLLMLFGYIIIGLSLVSMCINLIQAKLEKTYDSGKEDILALENNTASPKAITTLRRRPSIHATLGVLQTHGSNYSINSQRSSVSSGHSGKRSSKVSQTLLSFPSPSHIPKSGAFRNFLKDSKGKLIPTSYSIDDVMRLVDTEEDDVIILSELTNQYAGGSGNLTDPTSLRGGGRRATSNANSSDFENIDDVSPRAALLQPRTLQEIEEIEAMEDRILLATEDNYQNSSSDEETIVRRGVRAAAATLAAPAAVHFRARASVTEQRAGENSSRKTGHTETAADVSSKHGTLGAPGKRALGGTSADSIQVLDSLPEDEEVHSKTLPRSYSHI